MRMDEESFILSPITYNLFDFLKQKRIDCGRMHTPGHTRSSA